MLNSWVVVPAIRSPDAPVPVRAASIGSHGTRSPSTKGASGSIPRPALTIV